jgi:hypothetical protein
MTVVTTTQTPHPIRLHWGHTPPGVYSKVKTHSKQPLVLILSRDKLPLCSTFNMAQTAVPAGTSVFPGYDSKEKRVFYWFRTPDGTTGGVVMRGENIPQPGEEVMIYPEDGGKPFIGFKEPKAVLTY